MLKEIDDLIEYNLKLISESNNHSWWKFELQDLNNETLYESERLAEIMQNKGLLEIDNERCILTEFGFNIYNQGGWKAHKQRVQEERTRELLESDIKNNIEKEKSLLDIKLKKWQIKTFWPIFIFALLGAILSIYNFYNFQKKSNNYESLQEEINALRLEFKIDNTKEKNAKSNLSQNTRNSDSIEKK